MCSGFARGFLNFFCGGVGVGFFMFLVLVVAWEAAFARRNRRKAAGANRKKAIPPDPRAVLVSWSRGCDLGRLGLQRIACISAEAEAILCKFAASSSCGLSGSRCEAWLVRGEADFGVWRWWRGKGWGLLLLVLGVAWEAPSSPRKGSGCYGLLRVVKDYLAFLQNLRYTVIMQTNIPLFRRKKRAVSVSSAAPARGNPAYSAPSPWLPSLSSTAARKASARP